MRLINVDTFELEEFMDHRSTHYAILSHTWGNGEVTLVDMQRGLPHAEALPGFEKIRGACRQAASDGFKFVWVDTCCIDKSSSAELSEAINSMLRWYSDAKICYAYLSDVAKVGDGPEAESQFRNSRWFTRGWTLQELLAPKEVVFYSREWIEMGSKEDSATTISEITGIDPEALGTLDITRFSIAERMSWASSRVTTRQEDIAYCLLGLFAVNMALLYGEGERAFIRLEEEIIKSSDDHSIFAWTSLGEAPPTNSGLLAISPLQFKHSGGITPYEGEISKSRPYRMTNKGLSITMDVIPGNAPGERFMTLDCRTREGWVLAICIRGVVAGGGSDQYTRVRCDELYAVQPRTNGGWTKLFVRQTTSLLDPVGILRGANAFMLNDISSSFKLDKVYRYTPDKLNRFSSREAKIVCTYGRGGEILVNIPKSANHWVATAIFKSTTTEAEVWVILGWTDESGVSVHVCQDRDEDSDGKMIEVDLRPLSSCITKREIMHHLQTPEGEAKTELVTVSVSVDTQHEQGIDALYRVLYKVTVTDDRYVAIDSEQETT
jgi:hypothetical protein